VSIVERYMKRPYLVASLIFLVAAIGIIGFKKIPVNLFPDSEYPQIAVVTFYPGASASDIESEVTRIIEKQLNTIDGVRKVSSATKDEVSAVVVEFEYSKGLEAAATDVANELKRIEGSLPKGIRAPQIFKISSATQPTMTLALRPSPGSAYDLAKIRQLAENEIKEDLLRIPEVANVEVFGGYEPELLVRVDPDRMYSFGLSLPELISALSAQNRNMPNGLIIRDSHQFLLKTEGEFKNKEEAEDIVVARTPSGTVYLKDIADVEPAYRERQSFYHGNGHPAIGVNILRSYTGNSISTIKAVEKALPELKKKYAGVVFDISDTQKELIEGSVDNMIDALRDAVVMTVLVIFLFLADIRGMIIAAISIPFTYLLTFAVMYLIGYEFNMVTLTAVILAVGMLLDDAIVVIENIERRYHGGGEDLKTAVFGGTDEVMLAIFSGTYATVMVLLPIIYIGGFVQTVLRPLSVTLSIALAASYVVSVTVIPLFAPMIMRARPGKNRFERLVQLFDRFVISPIRDFFVGLTATALKHRLWFLLFGVIIFVASMRQMPLVGRDLMPPMDTGIIKVSYTVDSNTSASKIEAITSRMEDIIRKTPGFVRLSTTAGSEPGVISFGSGRALQQGMMTIHFVDRFHRKASIWQIEDRLRNAFRRIPGLTYVDVFDYGATPLSSIKAPVDLMISGPDPKVLDRIGDEVVKRLQNVRGLTSISRSWRADKKEVMFNVDIDRAALYHINPASISSQVASSLRGSPASVFRVPGQDGYLIRVRFTPQARDSVEHLSEMLIKTPQGFVPLGELGSFRTIRTQTVRTRQYLQPTLDVYAYRKTFSITHIQEDIEKALKGIELPGGYSISNEGDLKQMKESFGRLRAALIIGLVLLYFSLVPAFKSWLNPLTIMSAIPLALIGALWSMLITGKHQCMPSFMGMILLAGIVVKNSILLIDFIEEARARGESVRDAIVGSVRIRTRPILMTAVGTSVGMLPIALEWAIGLERLSPLAIVAIGGLMVSTFLTLVYVPVLYSLFDDLKEKIASLFKKTTKEVAQNL